MKKPYDDDVESYPLVKSEEQELSAFYLIGSLIVNMIILLVFFFCFGRGV